MQSSSSSPSFQRSLIGASPITDANFSRRSKATLDQLSLRLSSFDFRPIISSQSVISSARPCAKAEVRGANPRESASFKALEPQQLQGGFRKPVFVGASPTRGSIQLRIVV